MDARDRRIVSVLLQEEVDNVDKTNVYRSNILNEWEQNVDSTYRERYEASWPILSLRPYLRSTKFTVRTDHHAIKGVLYLADARGTLAK